MLKSNLHASPTLIHNVYTEGVAFSFTLEVVVLACLRLLLGRKGRQLLRSVFCDAHKLHRAQAGPVSIPCD
jgi:hypothetical protein